MTDEEFIDELVARLNLFLELDKERAVRTLMTPLGHAGYANVGHFLGQFCLPRGIDMTTPKEDLDDVKFLMPVIQEEGGITAFRAVSGAQLEKEATAMQQKMAEQQGSEDNSH